MLPAKRRYRAVTAACCLIRREAFFAAGGFDEAYRNGYEDVDLCLKLGEMGHDHWVAGKSVVLHHIGSSPRRFEKERPNQKRFFERWGKKTLEWGRKDWPAEYLRRHLRSPWRLNGVKTLDALSRLAGLRHGDSAWAQKQRSEFVDAN